MNILIIFIYRVIIALADGCGWGRSSQTAAFIASNSAATYLR